MANKIIFTSNINIGQNGAENDDEFLFRCFVDHPALAQLKSTTNPANFVLGSTGSGKTALLRMIAKSEEHCHELEVHQMAMNHIANSDVIRFLQGIDVDLNIFFQALWRHVLCIEYMKLALQSQSSDKFRLIVSRICEFFQNSNQRERFENFIRDNEHQFWNTIDENIIEITNSLTSDVNANLGVEVEKFVARAGYARGLSSEKKVHLQQRARKFVDGSTIAELGHVIAALSEYTRDRQDRHFVLIDRLDEPWVDNSIKYLLIQALFEALKGLQKLRNFKVVVALRNDVYERMIREAPPSQAQLEKYNDYIIRIKWTKQQLWELAEKRINYLFRWKYSSENVNFDNIFKQRVDGRIAPWAYMVERTLMRPRDIINFINETLQQSEGKSAVSKTDFLRGEQNYSELRLKTLEYEWQGAYPGIGQIMAFVLDRPTYFSASELNTSDLPTFLYDLLGSSAEGQRDSLWKKLETYLNGTGPLEPMYFCQEILSRLHLIGAIGLKLRANSPWQWFHETGKPVLQNQISTETKVRTHHMLHFALGISDRAVSQGSFR